MPLVINVRLMTPNDPSVRYCGRSFGGWCGSPLGNPFHLRGDESRRAAVIEYYERWLRGKVEKRNSAVLVALAKIQDDDALGCWCKPKACHCDVIIRVRQELIDRGVIRCS